jgi:hypothetical protein
MGYFCFHLGQTWVHKRIYGVFMFAHGVCALSAVALGFVSFFLDDCRYGSPPTDGEIATTCIALYCYLSYMGTSKLVSEYPETAG